MLLKEHLKRTVRISKPHLSPTTPARSRNRRRTHCIVYIFLGIVLSIIIALLIVTYDFSVHLPSVESPGSDVDVIVEKATFVYKQQQQQHGMLHNDAIRNNGSQSTVSTPIAQWPLQTANNQDCDAIFGNAYSERLLSCSADVSQFECLQNPFSSQIYCKSTNFIVDPGMIELSKGGEAIEAVSGRNEDDEYPKFLYDETTGKLAFNVDCEPQGNLPEKNGVSYYLHDIVSFLRKNKVEDASKQYHAKYMTDYRELCSQPQNNKTMIFLLTMRYEYANLYHQATDWYNFYQLIHSLGITGDYEIILLDGHARSQIDEAWLHGINAPYHFLKQLNGGQPVCLQNAVFVSAGYVGGISLKTVHKNCKSENKYVSSFGEWFLRGFGLAPNTQRQHNNITITLVCRRDYVAHPRNMKGRASRKFGDEKHVEQKIRDAVQEVQQDVHVNIRNIAWSDYSFREQLEIAASTDILIGVHGAGLSHVLFLPRKSGLIEISPIGFGGEPHFKAFSAWCGHKYISVDGGSELSVDPSTKQFSGAIKEQIEFIQNNIY